MVHHIDLIKRTDGERQAYMEGYKAGYNKNVIQKEIS